MSPSWIEPPSDADERRAAKPVIVYALDRLPPYDAGFYEGAREGAAKIGETVVPPSNARPSRGDCGSSHSSDKARCHPLKVEIFRPRSGALEGWRPPGTSAYRGE